MRTQGRHSACQGFFPPTVSKGGTVHAAGRHTLTREPPSGNDSRGVDAYCEGVMDPSLYDQMLPSLGGYSSESSMFPIATEEDPWDSPICSYESTAKDKVLDLPTCDVDAIDLKTKPIHLWTPTDTVNWILKVAQENGLECEEIHNFRDVDGCRLKYMNEELFYRLEPNCGRALYRAMQNLKLEQGHPVYEELPIKNLPTPLNSRELDCIERESLPEDKRPRKGKVGRPRIPGTRRNKKQEKKTGRLWEFIRDLLLKPEYCPSLICWEDHDNGIFRFVHSEKVARLWGTLKENPKMTYEKLSRAMRYYYKSKVLQPVLGRRLVYKFGPTATGWRTPNPNFKNKDCVKSKL